MDIDLDYLDPETFEDLCNDLLMQEANGITTIDGSGGDKGIDCFKGTIDGEITIFQHKYHTGRLEYSQETQITESFQRAQEEHPDLEKWILLIATEFTHGEQEWFQNNLVSPPSEIEVTHWNKPKIENRLIQYDFLVERYFNESLFATGKKIDEAFEFMSGSPVERVMGAGDVLRDLREEYSHLGIGFNYNSKNNEYMVSFDPEFDIKISSELDLDEEQFERLEEGKTVELSEEEVEKLEISPGIFDIEEDFDSLIIQPSYKSIEKPVQLEVPSSNFQKELSLGVEELSEDTIIVRTNDDLFNLYLVVPSDDDEGEFGYEPDFVDEPIHRIAEFFEFLHKLDGAGDLLIRDTEDDDILFRAESKMSAVPEELDAMDIFVENLYEVEANTGETFKMTSDWDEEDFSNARIARDVIVDGRGEVSWSSFDLTVPSVKAQQLLELYDENGALTDAKLRWPGYSLPILGREIEIGDVFVELPSAELKNRDEIEHHISENEEAELEFKPSDSAVIRKRNMDQ